MFTVVVVVVGVVLIFSSLKRVPLTSASFPFIFLCITQRNTLFLLPSITNHIQIVSFHASHAWHSCTHAQSSHPSSSPTDSVWESEGECSAWYLTAHLQAHQDLHEWKPREEAVLRHDHPHPWKDVLPVVASCSASFHREAVWVLCMLSYPYYLNMWRILCTYNTCILKLRLWIHTYP